MKLAYEWRLARDAATLCNSLLLRPYWFALIGGALGIALSYITGALFNALADGIFAAIYSWQAAVAAFFAQP